MAGKLRDLAAWSEAWADADGQAELRAHAAMYRADADRIATLVSQPERPDRETNI